MVSCSSRMETTMNFLFVLTFACSDATPEQSKEERTRALQERAEKLGERWKAHKKKKEAQKEAESEEDIPPEEDDSSKSTWEKARDMNDSVA